jgi:hypothetical protein
VEQDRATPGFRAGLRIAVWAIATFLGASILGACTGPPAITPTPQSTLDRTWPNADNTGVPDGVVLTPYTGRCTIDEDNTVIDAAVVDCDRLRIVADNVTILRTRVNGRIDTPDPADKKYSFSFRIEDSEVHLGNVLGVTGIKQGNFTAKRIEVTGGARSIHCERDCVIEDSWIHAQASDPAGKAHLSGVRMSQGLVLRHNTLLCEAVRLPGKGACSAALTGYGDWAPVQNNLIEGNLFQPGSSSYCAYGGSTKQKPFSSGTRDIRFIGNVFERGHTGTCGTYGPIGSFDPSRPGNAWRDNVWDDGTPIPTPTYRES